MSASARFKALGGFLGELPLAIGCEPRLRVSDKTSDGQAFLRRHLVKFPSRLLDAAAELVVRPHAASVPAREAAG